MSDTIPYRQIIDRVKSDIDWIAEQAYAKGYNTGVNETWEKLKEMAKMPEAKTTKIYGETRNANIINTDSGTDICRKCEGREEKQAEITAMHEEIKDEVPKNCSTCRCQNLYSRKTCQTCLDYGNWKPKDEQKMDCLTCKHLAKGGHEMPCKDCSNLEKWEGDDK